MSSVEASQSCPLHLARLGIVMAPSTSTPSSRSSANHRLFREQNLQSAGIYFFKLNDPAPADLLDLEQVCSTLMGLPGQVERPV